ncbi:phage holin family protein [Kibdelosporangium philippinense]|uniref:Phage holin family protein n=1 Tax=Kibdelosporangium philippinense TaxID=211113 RepID=A0ABS8ZXY7_9PSEU|nr:phage holin family protein [Kibdelosporangium philippinense]MCE7010872.1 phage holin family protein [Kibdelosporangium philippinense]
MSSRTDDRSISELVGQASEQISHLVRDEMRLAAKEIGEKGKRAGIGAGLFGGAGLFAFLALATLITSGILALSLVLAPWLAALLIGLALLLIAGVASLVGRKQINAATPPIPQEAAEGVKTDIATVKEGMHR